METGVGLPGRAAGKSAEREVAIVGVRSATMVPLLRCVMAEFPFCISPIADGSRKCRDGRSAG